MSKPNTLCVLQETSCCSTDDVQSGDMSSSELPLLKSWDGQRTLWIRAGIPQKHFQFYFPFSKRTYFTVTLWSSLFLIYFIHSHGHHHASHCYTLWLMNVLNLQGVFCPFGGHYKYSGILAGFFCLDCITCVTVWGTSRTSAHSYCAGQWPGKGICMSEVPFQSQILSSGRHTCGIRNWNEKYNPEIRDITKRGKNCTKGS